MYRPRIIPVLLLKSAGLVKTVQFKNPTYIGDPINAVHIFNDLKADELIFLDITATPEKRKVNTELLRKISDEAYMPFAYGGNITSLEEAAECFNAGIEKIILNTAACNDPDLVQKISSNFGKQSVVVSIDVKENWRGNYSIYKKCGKVKHRGKVEEVVQEMQAKGAGEIMINVINRDGTFKGYDVKLFQKLSQLIDIPLIACGGAGTLTDLKEVIENSGASAAAAGSLFVYQSKRKGVLINYPTNKELVELFQ